MSNKYYPKQTVNGRKKSIHRHVMEEVFGRPLKKNEHVYHIDGNHLNNSVENLIVITKKYMKNDG